MQARIAGVGVWGPGFSNLEEFKNLALSGEAPPHDDIAPKPERIPSRERRRSPLMVKLAVEVADQACRMASVDSASVQSVFSSGIGDADITDYMCRILAGPEKLLSPTKFCNSVHNAAAGYWSISTGSTRPATFVSSMHNSFSLALVEAMVQLTSDNAPVLLVISDLVMPGPMQTMHPVERMLGVALLLIPADAEPAASPVNRVVSMSVQTAPRSNMQWPALGSDNLASLYHSSPAGRSLCFLEAICSDTPWAAQLPVSEALVADLSLEVASASLPTFSHTSDNCVDRTSG